MSTDTLQTIAIIALATTALFQNLTIRNITKTLGYLARMIR